MRRGGTCWWGHCSTHCDCDSMLNCAVMQCMHGAPSTDNTNSSVGTSLESMLRCPHACRCRPSGPTIAACRNAHLDCFLELGLAQQNLHMLLLGAHSDSRNTENEQGQSCSPANPSHGAGEVYCGL